MKNHEKAFSDIKNYYNDITLNNLALINSLKVMWCSLSVLTSTVLLVMVVCFNHEFQIFISLKIFQKLVIYIHVLGVNM